MAAVEAAALDAEAAQLATSDAADREIFALLAGGEACRLRASTVFFLCQGLLFGLSFVAGATAWGFRDEALAEALHFLEPCLTGLTMACAEAALIGSVLKVLDTLERTKAAALSDGAASSAEALEDRELRRRSWARATSGLVTALANAIVLVCSLLGASDGDAYGMAAWSDVGRPAWHADGARLLLGLRAGFGITAMGPALLDMQQLVLPVLPVGVLAPLVGARERGGLEAGKGGL